VQRPIPKSAGTPVEELDTPALLVDLERLDAKIAAFRKDPRHDANTRLEAWIHKTPAIARRQLEGLGLTGIAVRSLPEAEAFAAAGFHDIRILRPLVTRQTLTRLESLRRSARVVVDDDGPLWGDTCLKDAVNVSTRVTSAPEPGMAVVDCGQKAIGRDLGDPRVAGGGGWTVSAGSAEHGLVRGSSLAIGDWLRLVPADVATVFALHDFAYGVRGGLLEATWRVSARGAF